MKTNMNGLTPLPGVIPEFHAAVRKLKRPYVPITEKLYNQLVAASPDFYAYKGKKVTFGGADGGYALMPYID